MNLENLEQQIQERIDRILATYRQEQQPDGAWRYCLRGSSVTDAYMVILLSILHVHETDLIRNLSDHIASRQTENGAWKHYPDEPNGNLSATVEAYYALLSSGHSQPTDPHMQKARAFILANGGLDATNLFCKAMLALTGQIPWPASFRIPIEIALLPSQLPISLSGIAVHIRAFLVPMLIVADRKFSIRTPQTPDLSDLIVKDRNRAEPTDALASLSETITNWIKQLYEFPDALHEKATRHLEQYMTSRIESDGTLHNYSLPTVLMTFALLSLDYPRTHPLVQKAIQGLIGMCGITNGHTHLQVVNAAVWDTASITRAMLENGVSPADPTVQKASQYLLAQQHLRYGDWSVFNPNVEPGGWGMSDFNTLCPDIDDTVAALHALFPLSQTSEEHHKSLQRGFRWLMSMQNEDGGWPTYEKKVNQKVFTELKFQGMHGLTDPSTADMTGKVLELLGNKCRLTLKHPAINKAVNWLLQQQEQNGSWYGRWGICYIHGTSFAVRGLLAVGVSTDHPAIQKAVRWLESIQQPDDGWGESCHSDIVKTYVPLPISTSSQTAWALGALIAAADKPTPAISRGVEHLLRPENPSPAAANYPNGNGYSHFIYFKYPVSPYIAPVLALRNYQKKFISGTFVR